MWNVEKKSASRVDFPPTWWAIMHSDAKAGAHAGIWLVNRSLVLGRPRSAMPALFEGWGRDYHGAPPPLRPAHAGESRSRRSSARLSGGTDFSRVSCAALDGCTRESNSPCMKAAFRRLAAAAIGWAALSAVHDAAAASSSLARQPGVGWMATAAGDEPAPSPLPVASDSSFLASNAPAWVPDRPVPAEEGWETGVRMPLRIATLPLSILGYAARSTTRYLEEHQLHTRVSSGVSTLAHPPLGLSLKPAHMGPGVGFSAAADWSPSLLGNLFT